MSSEIEKLPSRIYFQPISENYRVFKDKLNNLEFRQLTGDLVREIQDFLYRPCARPLMTKTLNSYEF